MHLSIECTPPSGLNFLKHTQITFDYFPIFYLHSIKCNTTILIKSNCSVNNSGFYNAAGFSYFIKLFR